MGTCITCPRQLIVITNEQKWVASSQNGHYIGRGNHELRYDEENCNLQCAHCNAWMDKLKMLSAYRVALDTKYGDGTAKRLETAPVRYGARKSELLQVIADSQAQIAWYLAQT